MKAKKTIVTINVLIIFLMMILLSMGLYGIYASKNIAIPDSSDFDRKLASSVGKTYTAKKHSELVEVVALGDEAIVSLNDGLYGFSQSARNLGIIVILLVAVNLTLTIRQDQK